MMECSTIGDSCSLLLVLSVSLAMFDSMVVGREIYFQLSMVGDEEVSSQWLQQRFLVKQACNSTYRGHAGAQFSVSIRA